MRSINLDVEESIYIFKTQSGMTWAGLMKRGVESVAKSHSLAELELENADLKARIERMATVINSFTEKVKE
jgi:hypothetical protein